MYMQVQAMFEIRLNPVVRTDLPPELVFFFHCLRGHTISRSHVRVRVHSCAHERAFSRCANSLTKTRHSLGGLALAWITRVSPFSPPYPLSLSLLSTRDTDCVFLPHPSIYHMHRPTQALFLLLTKRVLSFSTLRYLFVPYARNLHKKRCICMFK